MYNVDDAIAKIDGYVISISGGGPFVGERKLVRINEVKRTAAYASLLTDNGGAPDTEDDQPDEIPEAPVVHTSEAAVEHAAAAELDTEAAEKPPAASRSRSRGSRSRSGGWRRESTAPAKESPKDSEASPKDGGGRQGLGRGGLQGRSTIQRRHGQTPSGPQRRQAAFFTFEGLRIRRQAELNRNT